MMISKSAGTDSEHDYNCEHLSEPDAAPAQDSESLSDLEVNDYQDHSESRITLPEPDENNITVLTKKLPNKPILPWNRYDSPWEEPEKSEPINGRPEEDSSPSPPQEEGELDEVE